MNNPADQPPDDLASALALLAKERARRVAAEAEAATAKAEAASAKALVSVGRLDLASTGLLLLTSDTQLAAWLTDPTNAIVRRYVVTVRGEVLEDEAARLTRGIDGLKARAVEIRKRSRRETHLVIDVSKEPVGQPFDLECEAIYWNGFQGERGLDRSKDWAAIKNLASAPAEAGSLWQ